MSCNTSLLAESGINALGPQNEAEVGPAVTQARVSANTDPYRRPRPKLGQ